MKRDILPDFHIYLWNVKDFDARVFPLYVSTLLRFVEDVVNGEHSGVSEL